MPVEGSVSVGNEHMSVRDLVKQSAPASKRSSDGHVHRKPLHLPATEAQIVCTDTPYTAHKGERSGRPGRRRAFKGTIVVGYGAFEVSVESVREVVNELFYTAKTGSLADLVVITCQCGVAKSDVLAYLRVY
jgi:hypothetical protein